MGKKLDKAYDQLGVEFIKELESLSEERLKAKVVESSEALRLAQEELEANPSYQKAKDDIKDLSAGKKEVDKRQKAIILVSLSLLSGGGK